MRIVMSGGGTLGPVMPLLMVAKMIKEKYLEAEIVWIGTKNGPEKEVVEKAGLQFFTIGAGKWRRYFSLWNVADLFKIVIAWFQSLFFLVKERPTFLVSAGGFVSVPLHLAARLLWIPTWVHQQDVQVGLANRLMIPTATVVTTALQETAQELARFKAVWIGNPVRDFKEVNIEAARVKFNLPMGVPVIFALGGGTGSAQINKMVAEAVNAWPREWQVIHLVGKDRPDELAKKAAQAMSNYHVYDFFNGEMGEAYALADVVVARAGFSTLSELAALSKTAVIVPMSGTHQEFNAKYFANRGGVVMLTGEEANGLKLATVVKELIENEDKRRKLGEKMHELLPQATKEVVNEVLDTLTK